MKAVGTVHATPAVLGTVCSELPTQEHSNRVRVLFVANLQKDTRHGIEWLQDRPVPNHCAELDLRQIRFKEYSPLLASELSLSGHREYAAIESDIGHQRMQTARIVAPNSFEKKD
jgi:hypothetical protein